MSDIEVRRVEGGGKVRFEAVQDEAVRGEMVSSRAGSGLLIIEHTDVDPAAKGQGIGMLLLEHVVDWVRGEGLRVIPLCPFAKAMFGRHPELRDVLQ